jgi:hypothetical protein
MDGAITVAGIMIAGAMITGTMIVGTMAVAAGRIRGNAGQRAFPIRL